MLGSVRRSETRSLVHQTECMALATAYDTLNAALFLPCGGSHRLRLTLVEALDVRPGHRTLEYGCGTGQVTACLLAAGSDVVAVDALPAMLVAARRRAPRATFINGDVFDAAVGGGFDRAVLSFVLHNFDSGDRVRLLRTTAAALTPDGQIGVLDWTCPRGRVRAAAWRRFIGVLESPLALQLLDGALDAEIAAAGLRIAARQQVANGRAQILVLRRSA